MLKNTNTSESATVSLSSSGTLADMDYSLAGAAWADYTTGTTITIEAGS